MLDPDTPLPLTLAATLGTTVPKDKAGTHTEVPCLPRARSPTGLHQTQACLTHFADGA